MYTIVSNEYKDQLIKMVNEMIEEGWQPIGGVAICKLNVFHQTMQRKKK